MRLAWRQLSSNISHKKCVRGLRDVRVVLEMPWTHCPAMQTTLSEDDCAAIVPISKRTVNQNIDHSPIKFTKRMGKTANSSKIIISYHSKMQELKRNSQVSVSPSVQRCKQSSRMDVGNRIVHEYSESLCAVYAPTHEIVKGVWEKRRDEDQTRLDVAFISAKKSAERQLQGAIVPFLYIDLYCSLIILIGSNLRSTTWTVLSERLVGLSWAERIRYP